MSTSPDNPWLQGGGARGDAYDRRFAELEATGAGVHGEADFVTWLGPSSVLDAGCGTGRLAVELSRRGVEVVGVDLDPSMLVAARAKAPAIPWVESELATVDLGRTFEAVVAAGNVMIFLTPGTESAVVANLARHLAPGGLLVAGFSLRPGGLGLTEYDDVASGVGFTLAHRWATWDRRPSTSADDYAVSVHRLGG